MPIAAILGLGAALDYYYDHVPPEQFKIHLATLCARLIDGLLKLPSVNIIGNIDSLKSSGHLVSFTVNGFHAHDVAAYLNQFGICVRAGHHCAQPLHAYLGITATVRVSFHVYNNVAEVDYVLNCLNQLVQQGF